MYKPLCLGAALLCANGLAHAQNSVTLYGIIDQGIAINTNAAGSRQYALTSGNESGSRWGLRGREELGGGLFSLFVLEGGFNGSTGALGQNGDLFGRQVYVGLGSSRLGTLTAGRQYLPNAEMVGIFEAGEDWALSGAGYGAHPGDLDDLDGSFRVNNALKYSSPTWAGFNAEALYSFGGVAGSSSRNQIYGFGLGWQGGPFKAAATYTFARNPNFSLYGNKANDSASGSNMASPVYSGYASAGSQQIVNAGGTYTLGAATFGAVYSNTRFQNLGATAVSGSASAMPGASVAFNTFELNAKYLITPALQVAASYALTRSSSVNGREGAKYSQLEAGLDYSLSKRTDLYAVSVYQLASGTDSTGHKAVAAVAFATPSSNSHQLVTVAGIRHRF
ncbi:porin [Burkholderia gladioli]|uniref:porin n=1 Tax=Burkholderia gladioli TaxID=28095 RepID=UPI00164199C4|nr:porin [Burkholderia gladioli]